MNPDVCTIFYMNSVLDFPQYQLHAKMLEKDSLMLRNVNDTLVKIACPTGGPTNGPKEHCDVFDMEQEETRLGKL